MLYEYTGKVTMPNLDQIHLDVAASEMTDKTIEWCRWDEATGILKIVFTNTLSAPDKTILDNIVVDNS